MQSVRNHALAAYYYATLPYRKYCRWQLARSELTPLSVLFYHRVADRHPNSWTISNRQFARQIQWLSEHVKLVSLERNSTPHAVREEPRVGGQHHLR